MKPETLIKVHIVCFMVIVVALVLLLYDWERLALTLAGGSSVTLMSFMLYAIWGDDKWK